MESADEFIKRKHEEFINEKKMVRIEDIGKKMWHLLERKHWTFMTQSNIDEKVFVIERLERKEIKKKRAYPNAELVHNVKIGDIEYRMGYFIVAKNGKYTGEWVWGQFCPFIPQNDFNKLIDKAKSEGTII